MSTPEMDSSPEVAPFVGSDPCLGQRAPEPLPSSSEGTTMTTPQAPGIDQIRGAWEDIARGFDEFVTPQSTELGTQVVNRLGLQPGTRLLDVASGSGALSIPAARAGADVVAVDLAPGMTERLDARARAEGLSTLHAQTMDGHALELADDTFDVAVSVNGVSLFPDLARGLAELVRVTRPGGRVVIAAFGPIETVEFIAFVTGAIRAVAPDIGIPADPPPLPFQVADRQVLRTRLADAGLREIQVDAITWETRFRSARHLLQVFAASHPIGTRLVSRLGDEQWSETTRVLDGMLRERSTGAAGAVLRAGINVAVGTV